MDAGDVGAAVAVLSSFDHGGTNGKSFRLVDKKGGANDYVTKPIDFPVLFARVQTQLALKNANDRNRDLVGQLESRNEFIRSIFGRYVSDTVVEKLLDTPDALRLGGETKRRDVLLDRSVQTSQRLQVAPDACRLAEREGRPRRRYYELTADGAKALAEGVERMTSVAAKNAPWKAIPCIRNCNSGSVASSRAILNASRKYRRISFSTICLR